MSKTFRRLGKHVVPFWEEPGYKSDQIEIHVVANNTAFAIYHEISTTHKFPIKRFSGNSAESYIAKNSFRYHSDNHKPVKFDMKPHQRQTKQYLIDALRSGYEAEFTGDRIYVHDKFVADFVDERYDLQVKEYYEYIHEVDQYERYDEFYDDESVDEFNTSVLRHDMDFNDPRYNWYD